MLHKIFLISSFESSIFMLMNVIIHKYSILWTLLMHTCSWLLQRHWRNGSAFRWILSASYTTLAIVVFQGISTQALHTHSCYVMLNLYFIPGYLFFTPSLVVAPQSLLICRDWAVIYVEIANTQPLYRKPTTARFSDTLENLQL